MKLSVRDVHPDGSRNGRRRESACSGGRSADSDELLNDNEEKLEAAVRTEQVASPSRVVRRRRPQVTALRGDGVFLQLRVGRRSPSCRRGASKTRLAVASRSRQKDCQI